MQEQQAKFIHQLEVYRDRLLDISWRNRSVLLRKTPKKWAIDLAPLGGGTADEAILDHVHHKESTCLVRDSVHTEDADEWRDHLTQLSRQANLTEEETGLKETYLGFPFLAGRITTDHYVRAPLLLFPTHVTHTKERRPQGWHAEVMQDEDVSVNRALLAALRKVGGIRLPRDFEEQVTNLLDGLRDEEELTPQRLYEEVATILRKNDWELPDNPWAPIKALPTITKEQEQSIGNEPLHLEPYAVLGSFPQGSEAIYEDYEDLIERAQNGETDQGIIDNLLEAPADQATHIGEGDGARTVEIDSVPDRELNNVLDSDASQDQALLLSRGTECTVVRGPPGTGKSQTIVNLISNSLWQGERVLVVCQKRTALDVVYTRLHDEGLGNCALLVHDAKSDRGSTYRQMAQVLNGAQLRPPGPGRNAAEISAQIDRTIQTLNRLVKPLWQPFHGTKLSHLYAMAQPGAQPRLQLNDVILRSDWPDVADALQRVDQLEEASRRYDASTHPWHQRQSFAPLGTFGRNELQTLLDAALSAVQNDYDSLPLSRPAEQVAADLAHFQGRRTKFLHTWSPKWRQSRRATHAYLQSRNQQTIPTELTPWINGLQARANTVQRIAALSRHLRPDGAKQLSDLVTDRRQLEAHLRRMTEALTEYEQIREHDHRRSQLTALGHALIDTARQHLSIVTGWANALRQEVVLRWIQEAENTWPDVSSDTYERHHGLREELDRLLEDKRHRLVKELDARTLTTARTPVLPPGDHHGNRRPDTDWNKALHELEKQRRVWPVRKLVDSFRHVIDRAAPCWLVSPETVSEVFPLERGMFDVVIFDEASQLAVERSLPSIYRGKRIIVAGDEKQLRPFDLFMAKGDDEEEDDGDPALEAESLLMLAKRIYGFRYLTFHYRSRHAELIDYSNHAFYGGTLEVIASLHRSEEGRPPSQPAIQWHRVNGIWQNRSNTVEASKVVDLIHKTLKGPTVEGKTPSIGVITFNDQQRNLVLDEIQKKVDRGGEFASLWTEADNPPDGNMDRRPFVKNIETVQGDERDVIIFSVAYGKDPQGVFRQQFGSLSMDGGENRLNVAVTRAKYGVHVVSSIDPKDLRADTTRNPGPKRLRDYLVYAEAVSVASRTQIEEVLKSLNEGFTRRGPTAKEFGSPLEESVYDALVQRGLTVDTQIGYSGYSIDLAVVHPKDPERYILAVECDGATYHSAKSARERDVGRQRFLQRMGWAVERIWSRNWWVTREREVQRIADRVARLVAAKTRGIAGSQDAVQEDATEAPRKPRIRPGL